MSSSQSLPLWVRTGVTGTLFKDEMKPKMNAQSLKGDVSVILNEAPCKDVNSGFKMMWKIVSFFNYVFLHYRNAQVTNLEKPQLKCTVFNYKHWFLSYA